MQEQEFEQFEQLNFVKANKVFFGFGVVALAFFISGQTVALLVCAVPIMAYRLYGYYRRGTVVIVTDSHLKIIEKGREKLIHWDQISKVRAIKTSYCGVTISRILRFKEGKVRHKLLISELENENAIVQNFTIRTA